MHTTHATQPAPEAPPLWLRVVMTADKTGSAWYVGTGFFFAPVLALVSPWPTLTTVLWVVISVIGLWLGLLGIAMATGLAMVLRSGKELSDDYWQSLLDYPERPKITAQQLVSR